MGKKLEKIKKQLKERNKLCDEASEVKKVFLEGNCRKQDVVDVHKRMKEIVPEYDPYWNQWNKFMNENIWKTSK